MQRVFISAFIIAGSLIHGFHKQVLNIIVNDAESIHAYKQPNLGVDTLLVVVDKRTGLMWMKHDFSFIKKRFLHQWDEVFAFQKEMDSLNYAGFADWRVPTVQEYRTLNRNAQDRKFYRKAFYELDSTSVWGKGPYSFWSSTTPNKHTASYISFIDGFATSGNRAKKFSSEYSDWKGVELGMSVRLVRNTVYKK